MDDESNVVAELEARGLYDPSAADAPERLALLEFLLGLGATVADMEAAGDELPSVASTVVLRGTGERFCRAEAAKRGGVTVDMAARLGRAAGLPDPGAEACVYSAEDVELLRTFAAGTQLLGEDAALQLVRVIGSALARIADAEVAAFLTHVGGPVMAADPSGLELARAKRNGGNVAAGRGPSDRRVVAPPCRSRATATPTRQPRSDADRDWIRRPGRFDRARRRPRVR